MASFRSSWSLVALCLGVALPACGSDQSVIGGLGESGGYGGWPDGSNPFASGSTANTGSGGTVNGGSGGFGAGGTFNGTGADVGFGGSFGGADAGGGGFGNAPDGSVGGGDATGGTTGVGGTTGSGGATTASKCGNGVIDPGEQCDGTRGLANHTCASVTLNSLPLGTLKCGTDCQFDTSGCHSSNPGSGGTGGAGTGGASGAGGTGTGGLTGAGGTLP